MNSAATTSPRSIWVNVQFLATLVMLVAAVPTALASGIDPMAYQIAGLVLLPVVIGMALLWFVPKVGAIWLGAVGLILLVLIFSSPAPFETEPLAELLTTWAYVLASATLVGVALPAFRSANS
ncbi:MAG: hypothetical protein WD178_06455 [Actinomycetota bacterium]